MSLTVNPCPFCGHDDVEIDEVSISEYAVDCPECRIEIQPTSWSLPRMNAFTPHGALAIPTLPIAAIIPSPSNPRKRFDDAYLDELAESIKTHGLIQPITVRPLPLDHLFDYNRKHPNPDPGETPTYEIVVGECRWRAAQRAGWVDIPAFWRELDDKQVLEIQVIENLQRRDVHPLEEADGYRMLIDRHQYRVEDIALKIGKSRSYVFGRMKLADLGDKGRDLFFDGSLDASVALLIARLPEADQNRMLKELQRVSNDGAPISYRDAKWRIRYGFTIDLSRATFPLDDATLRATAGPCTDCPKRACNAPELYPDIETGDVCTDTRCFEEKRLARREQLLDTYRENKVPVYVDDDAKMLAPGGNAWSIDSDKWIRLTEIVPDDPDERTYAALLGDQAPVSAVVEVGTGVYSELLELVEATAMAAALKQAGYAPAEDRGQQTEDKHIDAERAKEAEARRVEKERCGALRARIIEQLSATDSFTADLLSIITAIALAELRRANEYGEEFIDWINALGIETPEEYDEEQELEKACAIIVGWPLGKVLAFIAWRAVAHEVDDYRYVFNRSLPTPALDAMACAIGLDIAEPLTSTTAAQASEPLRDEKQADAPVDMPSFWPFPKRENETTQNPIETNA